MQLRRVFGWTLVLSASAINILLLWHFHDRYWYPTDDGFYAHIAERLLSGEVLNRDIQDIHPGFIHFLHAGAFRLFGIDMVSLRYPLILAVLVQGWVVSALLYRRGIVLAACGSVAMTALGVIQFMDPTPNWYCLSLSAILAFWMVRLPVTHPARLFGAGVLVGVLTLLRQLSGVWAAMAVVVLVILESAEDPASVEGRRPLFARALLLIMLAAVLLYLVLSRETEPGGLILMAVWPIAILTWLLVKVRANDTEALVRIARVAAGAAVSAAPLILYHVAHGSVGLWVGDNVFAAAGETGMPFFGNGWYGALPIAGSYQALSSADLVRVANGLYWAVLPMLSAINGMLVLATLRRERSATELVLPILASFYALVSLYFEGPLYLYYSVGLSLVSLLWFAGTRSRAWRFAGATTAMALTVVAVVFHAGQPPRRTPLEILRGDRVSSGPSTGEGLDRCSLRLTDEDREIYGRFVDLIQREARTDESILAIPNDPELYFLANRRNPTRFYNSALGIRTADDLNQIIQKLETRPPRVVIFRPDDKYNNAASQAIMDRVRSRYVRIATMSGRDVYRLP